MKGREKRKLRTFIVGDKVLARNYSTGDKWIPGEIVEMTGPVSYKVRIPGGLLRRHIDQLLVYKATPEPTEPTLEHLEEGMIPEATMPEVHESCSESGLLGEGTNCSHSTLTNVDSGNAHHKQPTNSTSQPSNEE